MTKLSQIIFQLNGKNYPYEFDYGLLRLGRTIYVEFDGSSEPKGFYSNPAPLTSTYYITRVNETITPTHFELNNKFKLDDSFKGKLLMQTEEFVDKEITKEALEVLTNKIRAQHMYKSEELSKGKLPAIINVIDRLELVTYLSKNEENENGISLHYIPLVVYLLLTCFDTLGQPDDWVDFGTWLRSKRTQGEREKVKLEGITEPVEIAKAFNETYKSLYGVKNSFNRFLHKVIPVETRRELLDSVKIEISDNVPSDPKIREESDQAKENFLYELRNYYTHYAHYIAGASPQAISRMMGGSYNDIWKYAKTWTTENVTRIYYYRHWPEAVERTVKIGLGKTIEKIVSDK